MGNSPMAQLRHDFFFGVRPSQTFWWGNQRCFENRKTDASGRSI